MFSKFSLKIKILAMVVPLGFWLFVVSIYMLNDFHKQQGQLEGLVQVTDAFDDYGKLISALQVESANSSLFLSNSAVSLADLEQYYKEKADPKILEAKRMITVELPFKPDDAQHMIKTIDAVISIRKKVQAKGINIPDMQVAYNEIIQELMINEGLMAKLFSAKGIELRLVNMTTLESLKDSISKCRAAFAATFAKDSAITSIEAGRLAAIRSAVTALLEAPGLELVPAIHDKTIAVFTENSDWQDLNQNMNSIMEKSHTGGFGVDPKIFSQKMSNIIEKMNLVLSSERESLEDFTVLEVNKASKKFYFVLTFVLLTIIGISIFCWYVVRDLITKEAAEIISNMASVRSASMVDNSPNPTMMCDPNGTLIYMNPATIENLKKLQQFLPEKVENLMGKSMDIFHKNPAVQRKIISDPRNLPHRALITLGPEKLELLITSSIDHSGTYLGAALSWSIVTARVELIRDLTQSADDLAGAAANVLSISSSLSEAAKETSAQANNASLTSEEVNTGVQTVANNMEAMVAAINEITKTTNEAATITNEAMRLTQNTNKIINQLSESSMDIGNVIKVISSIAQQTNLLALNATIEAARAGEAGKGFAVVANEVKELAKQTAVATSEITKKIETIQMDSKNAVDAVAEISLAIEKVNGHTGNIASSVEGQANTTTEVTRIVAESAAGVKQIGENISQVSYAASNTGKDASSAQSAAQSVESIAELLKKYVARLKLE
jgi:methyl-accepting chemotaxis protein